MSTQLCIGQKMNVRFGCTYWGRGKLEVVHIRSNQASDRQNSEITLELYWNSTNPSPEHILPQPYNFLLLPRRIANICTRLLLLLFYYPILFIDNFFLFPPSILFT